MTSVKVDSQTAQKLKSAAAGGSVTILSPDGTALLIGTAPDPSPVSEEEIEAALRSLRNPGRQRSPQEVRDWLSEQLGARWGEA